LETDTSGGLYSMTKPIKRSRLMTLSRKERPANRPGQRLIPPLAAVRKRVFGGSEPAAGHVRAAEPVRICT